MTKNKIKNEEVSKFVLSPPIQNLPESNRPHSSMYKLQTQVVVILFLIENNVNPHFFFPSILFQIPTISPPPQNPPLQNPNSLISTNPPYPLLFQINLNAKPTHKTPCFTTIISTLLLLLSPTNSRTPSKTPRNR